MFNFHIKDLLQATLETLYLVGCSAIISITCGLVLGIFLFLSASRSTLNSFYRPLSWLINGFRSIPFIILMISLLPFTRWLIGTSIGIHAAIVPLTVAAIPFYARIAENAFKEIPAGVFEMTEAFGLSTKHLIIHVLLPESRSGLIRGATLTIIALVGYSAMAGAVGGGGLGELAINYGYQRFDTVITVETVIILMILVQVIQVGGDFLAVKRGFPLFKFMAMVSISLVLGSQLLRWSDPSIPVIKVGVPSGWAEEVMKVAEEEASKKYQLIIQTIPFTDYVLPNSALANGSIDANIFQHLPYLEAQKHGNQFAISAIAKTFVYPLGIYSKRWLTLANIKSHAVIALPNDPSNEARALLLLQKEGLIQLQAGIEVNASVKDIVANPKALRFQLMNAAQLPRILDEVDLVALTNDYMTQAHVTLDQALIHEKADSLYANVIVVRTVDRNQQPLQDLVSVMHSLAVKQKTEAMFPHGAAIPAW